MKRLHSMVIVFFLGGILSFGMDASSFLKNKSDIDIISYMDALTNSMKYKVSEEIHTFSPGELRYVYKIIGKNEISVIYYYDRIDDQGGLTLQERHEIYQLIDDLSLYDFQLREHLKKDL